MSFFGSEVARPKLFFTGIWLKEWTSVRKIKEGLITIDLFAVLTTEPNGVVETIEQGRGSSMACGSMGRGAPCTPPACAAAIKVRFVLPHPKVFPKNNAVASLRCSRLPHWLFARFSLCRLLYCSIMISLHDLYNFRLPRGIGEWPEHQRIGLRTAPDLHSTLHGPTE